MTDATSPANGQIRDAESAPVASPDLQIASGHGDPAGAQPLAAPDSGGDARSARPGVASPAGWFPSASGEAAPPKAPDMEPARADASPGAVGLPGPEFWVMCHPGPGSAAAGKATEKTSRTDPGGSPDEAPRTTPVSEITPSGPAWGWPGNPGLEVSPEVAQWPGDSARRSVWQTSHAVWQNAGISWEQSAADPDPESVWYEHQPPEPPAPSAPAQPATEPFASSRTPFPAPPASAPAPAFPMPLSAPTLADAPDSALAYPRRPAPVGSPGWGRPDPLPAPPQSRPPEPDELFRAWQGSVRRASAGPAFTVRRRRWAWRALRAGVPAAVIVAVGAGAVMMLTGKPGEVLADRAKQTDPPPIARGGAVMGGAAAAMKATAFPGYPGQRGTVTVSSMASAAGLRLAVGAADGHLAIWRQAPRSAWTLVSATSPGIYQRPGDERLTSIAHGPAGWIAVGGVVSGADRQSVVVTSADGVTWQALDAAFAGPDSSVTAVTAGPNGYVVVGKHVSGRMTIAAMWWSADLRDWHQGYNGGLDGHILPSSVYAAAAVPAGFVAVGTHGDCHSIWTSPDGRHWTVHDIAKPAGATTAMLSHVTVNGSHVVAAGYAVMRAGDVPIVVVSADGGRHWHQIVLTAPGGLGAVTALTAAGSGFVAAGQAGPAHAQRAVTWSSPDGLAWPAPAPAPAGAGSHQITALTAAGHTVTGTAQAGTTPTILTLHTP